MDLERDLLLLLEWKVWLLELNMLTFLTFWIIYLMHIYSIVKTGDKNMKLRNMNQRTQLFSILCLPIQMSSLFQFLFLLRFITRMLGKVIAIRLQYRHKSPTIPSRIVPFFIIGHLYVMNARDGMLHHGHEKRNSPCLSINISISVSLQQCLLYISSGVCLCKSSTSSISTWHQYTYYHPLNQLSLLLLST